MKVAVATKTDANERKRATAAVVRPEAFGRGLGLGVLVEALVQPESLRIIYERIKERVRVRKCACQGVISTKCAGEPSLAWVQVVALII